MAYDLEVADRIRNYLNAKPDLLIEEKKMFGGLAFMINGKMCINVSGKNLMCRFNPAIQDQVSKRLGYQKVIMKGREYKGYCYVHPEGFRKKVDFDYWIELCLRFNSQAKSSKKRK